MNFLRNTLGVLLGLGVAAIVISFGVRIDPSWRDSYDGLSPFEHWERVLSNVKEDSGFFWTLLFSSGIGATIGGVVTAVIVKYAKVAYAILIGFIPFVIYYYIIYVKFVKVNDSHLTGDNPAITNINTTILKLFLYCHIVIFYSKI